MSKNILFLLVIWSQVMMAQYAPQAGQTGTTAIHADSSIFTGWVTSCTANLGYQNILDSSLGLVASGSTNSVLGKADGFDVLSLGDAGEAICRFESPIKDLPGWDFAVFENAFSTFLELAYVEVSSNGIDYYRFPSFSITQDTAQVGTFGALEAHHIHNLAGKYHGYYGTPFDLHELENEIGLDINYITHVKIVDVVGRIIEPYNNQDSEGNVINDPWPTPFNQGGFDLDAIGVIHQVPTSLDEEKSVAVKLYPNPIKDFLTIEGGQGIEMEIHNAEGLKVMSKRIKQSNEKVSLNDLLNGVYFVQFKDGNKMSQQKIVVLK